jgi:MFS transporter, DHA2 family, multidrug resistance protein
MGLGAGAIGTVATDLVIGTAPPERAGAASGISETAGELGGALGIAILGSIGTAVYRSRMGEAIESEAGIAAAEDARETLATALEAGGELPASILAAAAAAFVDGFQLAAVTGAALLAGVALAAIVVLRRTGAAAAAHG